MTAAPERKGPGTGIAIRNLHVSPGSVFTQVQLFCSVHPCQGHRHPDTDPLSWWHPPRHTPTHTHTHTHLRIQYNSPAAHHPHSPPRETATSRLPQRPPPGALLQCMTHTEPLNVPRSPDKAPPALTVRDTQLLPLFISPGSQTSQAHLPSWYTLAFSSGYTRPRRHTFPDTPASACHITCTAC